MVITVAGAQLLGMSLANIQRMLSKETVSKQNAAHAQQRSYSINVQS